ncbi:MAG: hypothetical protein IJL19_05410 [Clostridiales bacterium]|nr:hypothetical protein [Clostridiales bacterium]
MLVLSVYAMYTGPQKLPIFYFVLIATAVKTDFRKIVKIFLFIQATTFVIYLSLALLGIMGSGEVVEVGRIRSYLGYGWVNRASYNLLFMSLELLYLRKRALDPVLAIILSAVNWFVYVKTHTVFSMAITFMIIAYGAIYYFYSKSDRKIRFFKKNRKRDYYLLLTAFLVLIVAGIALILIFKSSNPFLYKLNRFVTGRLELGKKAIDRYGLHLGGNKLQWIGSSTLLFGLAEGNDYFYVDNGFLQIALEFGLIFTAFVLFMYTAAIKKAVFLKDYSFAAIVLILGMVFVFEPYVIDFALNPFVIYYFSKITIPISDRKIAMDNFDIRLLSSYKR